MDIQYCMSLMMCSYRGPSYVYDFPMHQVHAEQRCFDSILHVIAGYIDFCPDCPRAQHGELGGHL